MLIVDSDSLTSWSHDASKTGDSTKYPLVGVVKGTVTTSHCLVFNGCDQELRWVLSLWH